MFDLFYIIEIKDGWFNLCIKDTHYCVGCGTDPKVLLRTVKDFVKRYRTKDKFLKAISKTEHKGEHPNKQTYEHRKLLYETAKYDYHEEIEEAIQEMLEEIKGDTPFNSILKRKKTISLPKKEEEPVIKKETKEVIEMTKPKVLVKRKLIRI